VITADVVHDQLFPVSVPTEKIALPFGSLPTATHDVTLGQLTE
jgi:hypothetical protein